MNPLLGVKEDKSNNNVLGNLSDEVEVDKVMGEDILQRLVEGFAAQGVGEVGEGDNVPTGILSGGNLDLRNDRRPHGLSHAPFFVHLNRPTVLRLHPTHVGRIGMNPVDGQDELFVEPSATSQFGNHPIGIAHHLEDDGTGRVDGMVVRGQIQLAVGVVKRVTGTHLVGSKEELRFLDNVRHARTATCAVELRQELIASSGPTTYLTSRDGRGKGRSIVKVVGGCRQGRYVMIRRGRCDAGGAGNGPIGLGRSWRGDGVAGGDYSCCRRCARRRVANGRRGGRRSLGALDGRHIEEVGSVLVAHVELTNGGPRRRHCSNLHVWFDSSSWRA